jgi:cyclophilin family peptidyl-prolyl cis-trans isomerase
MKAVAAVVMGMMLVLALSLPVFAQDQAESQVKTEVKAAPATEEKELKNPMVLLETNYGNIMLELFPKEAPVSTENFLSYVRDGFYDGTIFHRVVKDFVLQAGGMNEELKQKQQKAGITNEATNGLKNLRGTLSMARTSDINSGSSHFFINLKDNNFLDHTGSSPQQYGYAVFGKVTDDASMQVVDKIAAVAVGDKG